LALKLHGARRLTIAAWPALKAAKGAVVLMSGICEDERRLEGPSVSNAAHLSITESSGRLGGAAAAKLGIGFVRAIVCTPVGIDKWQTNPLGRAKPLATLRKTCGNDSTDSMTVARWNRAPGAVRPSGIVSLSVSWIAPLPRYAAVVQADTRTILAPSPRAASIPVSALVRPGPVVVNTTTGALVAK
jgi:hypothetical protein